MAAEYIRALKREVALSKQRAAAAEPKLWQARPET